MIKSKFFAIAAAAAIVVGMATSASAGGPCPVLKKNGRIVAVAVGPYKVDARFGGYYRTKHPKKMIVYNKRLKTCQYITLPG